MKSAFLFSSLSMTSEQATIVALAVVLAGVLAFGILQFLFKVDDKVESRRKKSIDLAQEYSKLGFKRLPKLFNTYAIGDYSGLYGLIEDLLNDIRQPDQIILELEGPAMAFIDHALKNQYKRAEVIRILQSKLEAAQAQHETFVIAGSANTMRQVPQVNLVEVNGQASRQPISFQTNTVPTDSRTGVELTPKGT